MRPPACAAANAAPRAACALPRRAPTRRPTRMPHTPCRTTPAREAAAAVVDAPPAAGTHSTLLHNLGDVGDVPPRLMPFLLRLAHVR